MKTQDDRNGNFYLKQFLIILMVFLVAGCNNSQNTNDTDNDETNTGITVTLSNGNEGLAMTIEQLLNLELEDLTVNNWTNYYDILVDDYANLKLKDGYYETPETSMTVVLRNGIAMEHITDGYSFTLDDNNEFNINDFIVKEAKGEIVVNFPSEYILTREDYDGEHYGFCIYENGDCYYYPLERVGYAYYKYKYR